MLLLSKLNFIIPILISCFVIFTYPVQAGLSISDNQSISITAASNHALALKYKEKGDFKYQSGIYIAYANEGKIEFIAPSDDPEAEYNNLHRFELKNRVQSPRPTAITEAKGIVYFWDARLKAVIAYDPYYGIKRILTRDNRLRSPNEIIVSSERDVVIVDRTARGVFWLKDTGEKELKLHQSPELTKAVSSRSFAFLTWDTLAILERDGNNIQIFNIGFGKDEIFLELTEELPLSKRSRSNRFKTITSKDGSLYVADSKQIFTYVTDSRDLIPATPIGMFDNISDIAASYDNLFVVDGNEIKSIPKTTPIEIQLSGTTEDSQAALLNLYMYLDRKTLLPSKRVRTLVNYENLSEFLTEKKILLTPNNIAVKTKNSWFWRKSTLVKGSASLPQQQFAYWICRHNKKYCSTQNPSADLFGPINGNTTLFVPDLDIKSSLRRQETELKGTSISATLENFVISKDQRERVDYQLLQDLNQSLDHLPEEKLYKTKRGTVVLPHESWLIHANVPIADYNNPESELYRISANEGIEIYGLDLYTSQTENSHTGTDQVSDECHDIHSAHKTLFDKIKYPYDLYHPFTKKGLEKFKGKIGIVEKVKQVDIEHAIFFENNKPAWYTLQDLGKPRPNPVPQSLPQNTDAIGNYVLNKHHGTHVSALIGGRNSQCWRGLLPNSRLILADARGDTVRRHISNARSAGVKTFNISQKLGDSHSDIKKLKTSLIEKNKKALFVVAAGQSELNFDIDPERRPYPAGWGNFENIITVTSTFKEANQGKQYIDLCTEGKDILSATEDNFYGKTSGTSQAAPLVTAAAAYLMEKYPKPGEVKARLIATSQIDDCNGKSVWGGSLDFSAAVRFHEHSIFKRNSVRGEEIYKFEASDTELDIINFSDLSYHSRSLEEEWIENNYKSISIRDLLSLRRYYENNEPYFRVVFRDKNEELKIIKGAQLNGKIAVDGALLFDKTTRNFQPNNESESYFSESDGIEVNQIEEYYAKFPYSITW